MLTDAFQNAFDTALLVSADSDLVGPVRTIQTLFPAKRVVVVFPPARRSAALQKTAYKYVYLAKCAEEKPVPSKSCQAQWVRTASAIVLEMKRDTLLHSL